MIFLPAASAQVTPPSNFYLPYKPTWQLPGAIANCSKLKELIAEAELFRAKVTAGDHATIDAYSSNATKQLAILNEELSNRSGEIADLDRKILLEKIGILAGAAFFLVAAFTTSPVAIGALLGIEIVGGATLLGMQAIYVRDATPQLVAAYAKDRVGIFGGVAAEQAGSTGGKIISHSLAIAGILMDLYSLSDDRDEAATLRVKIKETRERAALIASVLRQYPPKDRGPWRAMLLNSLTGTIDNLNAVVAANHESDCLLRVRAGPTIGRP